MQSLDLSRLLSGHALLSLVASLSSAPVWNLPLALYGMVVTNYHGEDQNGDSLRQFAGLYAASFFLDAFWLLTYETRTMAWFLIVVNFLLKPVTLLSTLGQLRQRGHATFDLPGGFNFPGSNQFGNNNNNGGFPPARNVGGGNETMWQAPSGLGGSGTGYHERNYSSEEPRSAAAAAGHPNPPPPPPPQQRAAQQSKAQVGLQSHHGSAPAGNEGGGYHTLE